MGCCIIGALIISRWLSTFDFIRRIVTAPFGTLSRSRIGRETRRSRGAAPVVPLRSIKVAIVVLELGLLLVVAAYEALPIRVHVDHVVSFVHAAHGGSAPLPVVLDASICTSAGEAVQTD
ncbi:MAG: hypothetical protein K2Y27_07460 [Xanthobacteraceae bacterium]|nr:hypothetical protein [Xanthobacteraceae bacterium]